MKKEITQLQSIIGSVYKWWKIVYKGGNDTGTDNCTLCMKYFDVETCGACPVKRKTKKVSCSCSPYIRWTTVAGFSPRTESPYSIKISKNKDVARTAAHAELDFLFGLIYPSQFERVRLDLIGSGLWEKNAGIKRLPNQFLDWMEKAMEAREESK